MKLAHLVLGGLLLLSVLAACQAAAPETPVGPALVELGPGWTKIEPGGDTRCAHDTAYAFWVRPGTSGRLLLYFQGGGGCWDAETCGYGSSFYDDRVDDRDDPSRRAAGILEIDRPDNPFAEDTIVYMPSCTGDVHWGSAVREYPTANGEPLTIYHRGYVNAAAALNWAYTNVPDPDSVFVTGCSAGSVGSIAHAAAIIEQYPDVPVNQLGDSLAFVFIGPVNVQEDYRAGDNWPDWIPAVQALDPSQIWMADYYSAVAGHYPDYTFAQYNTEADVVQIQFYVANQGQPAEFPPALANSLSAIHDEAANFRSYNAPGAQHCILPRPEFYTLAVDGVALRDWVADLANDREVRNVVCPTCQVVTGAD